MSGTAESEGESSVGAVSVRVIPGDEDRLYTANCDDGCLAPMPTRFLPLTLASRLSLLDSASRNVLGLMAVWLRLIGFGGGPMDFRLTFGDVSAATSPSEGRTGWV